MSLHSSLSPFVINYAVVIMQIYYAGACIHPVALTTVSGTAGVCVSACAHVLSFAKCAALDNGNLSRTLVFSVIKCFVWIFVSIIMIIIRIIM